MSMAVQRRSRWAESHNDDIQELLFAIVGDLHDAVTALQATGDVQCKRLQEFSTIIQDIVSRAEKNKHLSTQDVLKAARLLDPLKDEVVRKLGTVCCREPRMAQECSQAVAPAVQRIKAVQDQLLAIFKVSRSPS